MSDENSKFKGAFESDEITAIMERRRKLSASQEWIVDKIFPAGAMHLIAGGSGVGKTTWLFQMLYEWEQALPLFGEYASHPCPWVYIACDRSLGDMQLTLERIGLGDWEFEAHSLEELLWDQQLKTCRDPNFADHVLRKFEYAKLVVVEGLQAVMPDRSRSRSQNKEELLWALEQRHILAEKGRTVIATTHNPKLVQTQGASVDERSKFLGSQGFIGSCSTMISIDKGKMEEDRNMIIMGRNFPDIHLSFSQKPENNGRFVLEGVGRKAVVTESDDRVQFMTWAQAQYEFTVKDSVACGMRMGVSDATVERWLRQLVEEGVLVRIQDPQDKRRMLYRPNCQ